MRDRAVDFASARSLYATVLSTLLSSLLAMSCGYSQQGWAKPVTSDLKTASSQLGEQPANGLRATGSDRHVTLKFPDRSLGAVALVGIDERGTSQLIDENSITKSTKAVGTVDFNVPAGMLVLLVLSREAIVSSELLNQIPANGIDVVRFNFLSMDEADDRASDQVLTSLLRLKHLKQLIAEATDISDKGLERLASLKELQGIQITATRLSGSCFKALSTLPELKKIVAVEEKFDQKNFQYLAAMPRLQVLSLRSSNTSTEGLRYLRQSKSLLLLDLTECKNLDSHSCEVLAEIKPLRILDLGETKTTNKSIEDLSRNTALTTLDLRLLPLTDACIPSLKKITQLKSLNISNTQITMKGVENLRGLKLTQLSVPYEAQLKSERSRLREWFPQAKFMHIADSIQERRSVDFRMITHQKGEEWIDLQAPKKRH